MGTTIDAGEQHCSDTRDASGDRSVFLRDLGGLGVWMSFLAAAGDMYSCSSVCNLISFWGFREWCNVFAGLNIGLMWPNAVCVGQAVPCWSQWLGLLTPSQEWEWGQHQKQFCFWALFQQSTFVPACYCTQAALLLVWCCLKNLLRLRAWAASGADSGDLTVYPKRVCTLW